MTAIEAKTKYFEELTGWGKYWTDVHTALKRERIAWGSWGLRDERITDDDVKTHLAVQSATTLLGVSMDHMLQASAVPTVLIL
jgi:hypothetical protein